MHALVDPATVRQLISFRIGAQDFCLDIVGVREIRGWTPATPVPHAPAHVLGVINLRGAVMPVVDLAARLGMDASQPTARHVIIVARIGEQQAGLLVDAVGETFAVGKDAIQPLPDLGGELARTVVKGFLQREDRLLSLIVLDRILQDGLADAA